MDENNLIGKSYTFPDGNTITVLQIKMREDSVTQTTIPFVTFIIKIGPGIPKKEVMSEHDFVANYGHLFGIKDPPTNPVR